MNAFALELVLSGVAQKLHHYDTKDVRPWREFSVVSYIVHGNTGMFQGL